MEARSRLYPWVRAEAQVWGGQAPNLDHGTADVVVLSVRADDPTGHAALHAGRFVLATGAVRPVQIDGAEARLRTDWGGQIEAMGGVPVAPMGTTRAYDWLAGGRLSQRVGSFGVLGASYLERRDHGSEANEELGADFVLYLIERLSMNGRGSFSLVSRDVVEALLTASYGDLERRLEVFGSLRNASLILPATSLFSVLSNAPSVQAGTSGRLRVAPRLRLEGLLAYRAQDTEHGLRMRAGGTLWLSDEGESSLEGSLTRDGVGDGQWTGLRTMLVRELWETLRLMGEVELVLPDHPNQRGSVWPWGRLSASYRVAEVWRLSAGAEGSSSPQFTKLFQALLRVSYEVEGGTP